MYRDKAKKIAILFIGRITPHYSEYLHTALQCPSQLDGPHLELMKLLAQMFRTVLKHDCPLLAYTRSALSPGVAEHGCIITKHHYLQKACAGNAFLAEIDTDNMIATSLTLWSCFVTIQPSNIPGFTDYASLRLSRGMIPSLIHHVTSRSGAHA